MKLCIYGDNIKVIYDKFVLTSYKDKKKYFDLVDICKTFGFIEVCNCDRKSCLNFKYFALRTNIIVFIG